MLVFSTFDELSAYLLVYVARVDGQIHYLEESALKDLGNLLALDEGLIRHTQSTYNANVNVKVEEVLKSNGNLIRRASMEAKQQLIEALFAIVNSDGKVQTEESGVLRLIREAFKDH